MGKWGKRRHRRRKQIEQVTQPVNTVMTQAPVANPFQSEDNPYGLNTMQDCLNLQSTIPEEFIAQYPYNRIDPANDSLDVAKANLSKAHETLTESERSISVAKRAIVVSVIIAIVTTIINVCLNLHIASDRTVVLDNDQNAVFVEGQNKTIEAIKAVGTQLDDSINVHVKNQLSVKDTISTVQVKKVRPAQSKSGNQKPQD